MSDRNPSTQGKLVAFGTVRDDVFDHVFKRINEDLNAIGLITLSHSLQLLKGKKIRIEVKEVR